MDDSITQTDRGAPNFPWAGLAVIGVWTWAIWSCAEHWRGNPNYSYGWAVPLLALGFAIRRYLQAQFPDCDRPNPATGISVAVQIFVGIALGGLVFFLEYSREQIWHPEIVLLSICLLAVTSTIVILRFYGGQSLARAELFPVLFFLTAVPWPPRLEQPIVSTLMRWVAETTTEVLHWMGVEAQTSGAAIALRSGVVGITEACSGVRSLQAGIMFGLAMGEWFLLRPARRVLLLLIAVALAMATNLLRTLLLALQAERHGLDSVERMHDLIGNIVITALIAGIWIAGKLLARGTKQTITISAQQIASRARELFNRMTKQFVSGFFPLISNGATELKPSRSLLPRSTMRMETNWSVCRNRSGTSCARPSANPSSPRIGRPARTPPGSIISFGNRHRGTDLFWFTARTFACREWDGSWPARPSRLKFRLTIVRSAFMRSGSNGRTRTRCNFGEFGEMANRFRSIISPNRSWAQRFRRRLCNWKANANRQPKLWLAA
jgi:exosortase